MEKGIYADFIDAVTNWQEAAGDQLQQDLEDAADELEEKIRQSIQSGGGPPNTHWPPLSQATLTIRQKEGISSNKPLLAEGGLVNALQQRVVNRESDGTPTAIEVGWFNNNKTIKKAAISIFGTTGGNMQAARIAVSEAMRTMMALEYGIHISQTEIRIPPRPLLRPCASFVFSRYAGQFTFRLVFKSTRLAIRVEDMGR